MIGRAAILAGYAVLFIQAGAPVPIRDDVPAEELRRLARLKANGRVACRLLALASALDGMSRERAARQAGMDRQTLRDWVIRFNADGIEGLHDRPRSGWPAWLEDDHGSNRVSHSSGRRCSGGNSTLTRYT